MKTKPTKEETPQRTMLESVGRRGTLIPEQLKVFSARLESIGTIDTTKPMRCTTLMRQLRMERKLTQFDISLAIGLDPSLISRLERGRAIPSPNQVVLLETYFNMNIEDLLKPIFTSM